MYNDNGFLRYTDDELYHSGISGMKWGFTDGVKNGKRIAQEFIQGIRGQNYHTGKYGSADYSASVRPGSQTSKAYQRGAAIRSNARNFRDSIDDTVGTWIDDQKDYWGNQVKKIRKSRKAASDYLSGLKGGSGKAGSADFNANVRSKSYQKGLSVRNGVRNKIKSIDNIRRGVRDSIDDTVGTWIDDQKDFWKRKK